MSPIGINTVIPDGFERRLQQSLLTDPWEPLYSNKVTTPCELRPAVAAAAGRH